MGNRQRDSAERAFDLVRVAVHEIGHALGIDHLNVSGSVMAPYVSPSEQFTGLRTADVDAALALYGAATTNSTPLRRQQRATKARPGHDNGRPRQPHPIQPTMTLRIPTATGDRGVGFWWWCASLDASGSRVFAAGTLVAAPQQHNAVMPADVNQDGNVTSRDALAIINQLVRHEGAEGESTMLADTNGDGTVTAGDALFVINEVARIERRFRCNRRRDGRV